MDDKEYKALLQQRSYLIESLNAKKNMIESYNNYIEKAEANIMKFRQQMKDTKMQQVLDEFKAKISGLDVGIKNSKSEIANTNKKLKEEQETFNNVAGLIEKQKKIIAGEFYDEEVIAKETKIYNKTGKK